MPKRIADAALTFPMRLIRRFHKYFRAVFLGALGKAVYIVHMKMNSNARAAVVFRTSNVVNRILTGNQNNSRTHFDFGMNNILIGVGEAKKLFSCEYLRI